MNNIDFNIQGIKFAFNFGGDEHVVSNVNRLVGGSGSKRTYKFLQIFVCKADCHLFVTLKIKPVFKFYKLFYVEQKLVRILIINLLRDRNKINLVIF